MSDYSTRDNQKMDIREDKKKTPSTWLVQNKNTIKWSRAETQPKTEANLVGLALSQTSRGMATNIPPCPRVVQRHCFPSLELSRYATHIHTRLGCVKAHQDRLCNAMRLGPITRITQGDPSLSRPTTTHMPVLLLLRSFRARYSTTSPPQ